MDEKLKNKVDNIMRLKRKCDLLFSLKDDLKKLNDSYSQGTVLEIKATINDHYFYIDDGERSTIIYNMLKEDAEAKISILEKEILEL